MGFLNYFFSNKHKVQYLFRVYPKKQNQIWIYDQHLTSPIWKIAISEFWVENCIIFDDEDQYKRNIINLKN
ncbi:unnamed protein product [Paramecium primaurelia]|uniref:BART domain-containing protein n=1 Tax=Paramecium primaurelia TaxID=5886 RepID=A0A8S1MZ34_PARPR|nr:unnamed protein product [Paramecium primaurelia]